MVHDCSISPLLGMAAVLKKKKIEQSKSKPQSNHRCLVAGGPPVRPPTRHGHPEAILAVVALHHSLARPRRSCSRTPSWCCGGPVSGSSLGLSKPNAIVVLVVISAVVHDLRFAAVDVAVASALPSKAYSWTLRRHAPRCSSRPLHMRSGIEGAKMYMDGRSQC